MNSVKELAWAAGFLEGEGCFASCGDGGVSVTAPQVQRNPLEHLQKIFGGNIRGPQIKPKGQPIYRWGVHGSRAAAVSMTLLPMLSPRRFKQAVALIDKWKNARGHRNLQKTHCPQGHAYTEGNIYYRGKWRICRACTITDVNQRRRTKVAVITNT